MAVAVYYALAIPKLRQRVPLTRVRPIPPTIDERRPSAGACPGLNRGREPRACAAGSVLAVRTDETQLVGTGDGCCTF